VIANAGSLLSANNLFLRLGLRYKSQYPRRLILPKVIVEIFGSRCRSICQHNGRLWAPELWILRRPETEVVSIKNSARIETVGMEKMGNSESGNHLSISPASNIHQLEFLQINILIVIILVEVELVAGTAPSNPIVRLCAMPSPTICFYIGFLFVVSAILTHIRVKLPFNMSSTEKGTPQRPALLAFVGDAGAIER
jgi:hypothetical protein